MEYSVKRQGKTFEEYEQYLEETIMALEDFTVEEKAVMLQDKKEENKAWFDKKEKRFKKEERLGKIKDLRLAMHLADIPEKNPALMLKKILDEDDYATLTLLEEKIAEVDAELDKVETRKQKQVAAKQDKQDVKQWLIDNNIEKMADLSATHVKKIAWYLLKQSMKDD